MRDLIYLDEICKDKTATGMVDLHKLCSIGDIIFTITIFQTQRYGQNHNKTARAVIMDQDVLSPDAAYNLSLELGPRSS